VLEIAAPDFPRAHELTEVPFHPQDDYQCGPAALATVLNHAGVNVAPDDLVGQVYLPKREGSLQLELVAAARRARRVPYLLAPELDAVVREIAAGHPVLVLQNLGLSWLPRWHYAVVVGYDLDRREFILRSGREARRVTPFATFERTWTRAQRWALVVTAPDQIPATAVHDAYLNAVAQIEQQGLHAVAAHAYVTALQRWPDSTSARFGLGNARYATGHIAEAEAEFRAVVTLDPKHAAGWNNLAQTLLDQRRWNEAEDAARAALALGGAFADVARRTLEEIHAARAAAQP
jgi:tetratricopeptide (TPR) repeat protein